MSSVETNVADARAARARFVGVGAALAAGVLFGAATPWTKPLLERASPIGVAGLLYLGSGVGLSSLLLVRSALRRARNRSNVEGRAATTGSRSAGSNAGWLVAAILFGGVLAPTLLMLGLRATPASSTSLLLNLEGVFTALLAWFVFHENFDRRIAVGMAAIVLGSAFLSWQGSFATGSIFGPLAIAGACLGWAIDNNLTQKVSGADPLVVACAKGLVAGAVNTSLAFGVGSTRPGLAIAVTALLVGFVGYGLSLTLYVVALRHLGTARTAAYFSIAPFVGAIASTLVLHEPWTTPLTVSGALMAVGVWLHVTERHEHEHRHERLVHTHAHVHDEHHRHTHPIGIDAGEPHVHQHEHEPLVHSHRHCPDLHHRHDHAERR